MKRLILLCCLVLAAPLSAETKILAFSGSTRQDSYNKKLVQEAARIARQMGATVTVVDLKDYAMPFYDEDIEKSQGMPANAKKLRELMINSDAIIIATPEYNGAISAVLKNALDWASRSLDGKPSRDAFKGKKFAIMSASLGAGGGARALANLSAIIGNVGGEVVKEQVAVGSAYEAFDANGQLTKANTKQNLQNEIKRIVP